MMKSTRPCFGKHNAKEILSCELCSENKECYAAYVEMIKSDWYCYDCKKTATKECFHGHCVMPKYYAKAQGIELEQQEAEYHMMQEDEEAQAEQEAYLAQEEPENYYSDAEYED